MMYNKSVEYIYFVFLLKKPGVCTFRYFFQKYFGIFENGQKKCPKSIFPI